MTEKKEKSLTRKDVLRLIKENGGTAKGLDLSGKEFEEGIDLHGLNLQEIILKEAVLEKCHLEESLLTHAHLEGAFLSNTHLESARLSGVHLEGAELVGAHLEKARLTAAHLEGAEFFDAHLEEAELINAFLDRTRLSEAHLQGVHLFGAKFTTNTEMGLVDWGSYILGEENDGNWRWAWETYLRLKHWYTNAGMYDVAAKFYYREKEANRKGLKLFSKSWNHRLALEILRPLFGYGEDWKRVLYCMVVVIFGFAAAYYFWGSFTSSSFWDSLYYSATSFTALGYGQWAPQPTGWAKGMGAVEAIVGVSMMALLLVTFVRKWTR